MKIRTAIIGATMLLTTGGVAHAQAAAEISTKRTTYMQCIVDQTVRLGRNNSESGDTIVRAASSKCGLQEMEFSQSIRMADARISTDYRSMRNASADATVSIARARAEATDRAMAALLEARASS